MYVHSFTPDRESFWNVTFFFLLSNFIFIFLFELHFITIYKSYYCVFPNSGCPVHRHNIMYVLNNIDAVRPDDRFREIFCVAYIAWNRILRRRGRIFFFVHYWAHIINIVPIRCGRLFAYRSTQLHKTRSIQYIFNA